jgi:hypothetical protein
MPETAVKKPTGFVYFIRAGKTAKVKIGWTLDPYKRQADLQTACPHRLHLIGYIPGSRIVEHDWHAEWHRLREVGEWFHLDNDLRHAINARLREPDATSYLRISIDWRAMPAPSRDELRAIMAAAEAGR